MPIGSYKDWDECVQAQIRKGHSKQSAERICGAIEAEIKERRHKKE